MFFKSIRFSLTLWYAVTLAVVLVFFCSFLYVTLRNVLYSEVDRELLTVAEAVASPTLEPFRYTGPVAFDQVLEDFIGPRIGGKYVQILDDHGQVGTHTKNLQETRMPLPGAALKSARAGEFSFASAATNDSFPIRILTYPVLVDGKLVQFVQVGSSLKSASQTLDKILLVFGISIPLSLALWSFGGWFLAGRALKPVDILTRSAQKITAENLSHRLEIVNPRDEIGRLAATFNATLERLENAFLKIKRFSADVSHELRTPLTIIRGETEVGLKWAKEPEEFRELLQSNMEEVDRMSNIIDHLLELARAEEGEIKLDIQEVDMLELLSDLVQQARLMAQPRGVKVNSSGNIPLIVDGDWLRLRQVFINLIDNAIKYTAPGGDISLELEQSYGQARLSIIDSGSGVAAEHLPYIFDRFYRVDEARNRADGGSGLGLSIAKTFVQAHGGRIEVVSEPGKGSVFIVYLPLSQSSKAA